MPYMNPAAGAAAETWSSAGAPGVGVDAVQSITFGGTPTGGTFKLAYGGWVTAAIPWSAVNATLVAAIDAALEALGPIGAGGATVAAGTLTAGIGAATVTFAGAGGTAKRPHPTLTVADNSLTGTNPSVACATTTPGVAADGRGASKGAVLVRQDTGAHYYNSGTPTAPAWVAM